MKKLSLLLVASLLMSTLAFAHGNMEHVLGTVVEITDHSLSVKTADGSVKTVAFDSETHFLKGASAARVKDVLVGSRGSSMRTSMATRCTPPKSRWA